MQDLSWIATTPEGAQLGELAARTVQIVVTPLPWWTAPLEPIRWLTSITGTAPHTFYTMGFYAMLSAAIGLLLGRRRGALIGVAAALAAMLTLGGGFFALRTIDTWVPGGVEWRVPADAQYRLANLHAHSQASGGALMPEDLVAWHYAHGYRVLALSDSNGLRGIERARAYIEANRLPMVLVPAEEYRGRTHLLMFNIRDAIVPAAFEVPQAIAAARTQGGLVIVAHPWTSDRTPQQLVDLGAAGFEVSNGTVLADDNTRKLAERLHLAATGNLDFRTGHRPLTATVLPLWADTLEKVQQALARGACAALYFPDEVDNGTFHLGQQLSRNVATLLRERVPLLLLGLASWLVIGLALRRFRLPPCGLRPLARLGLVAILSLGVGAFATWCMWWQFRQGWLPRSEWALYAWALATPLAWWATLGRKPQVELTTATGHGA